MCSIFGITDSNVDENILPGMLYRGPDGFGIWRDTKVPLFLMHRRLSILDLSDIAAQPMSTPDAQHILSYNGEIYNFQSLRSSLLGINFRSSGDTEILLHLLARDWIDALPRLNGIYAFACWSAPRQELLLARDPLGIKPLYWCEPSPGTLAFASEAKALFEIPGVLRHLNPQALAEHLARSHASGEHTALRGIRRLLPGHVLRWSAADRSLRIERFWAPRFTATPRATNSPTNYTAAVGQLREGILAAVQRQLISDVPVGIFLSGGLDSSLIAAAAVKAGVAGRLPCYTITYPESENRLDRFHDDAPYARQLADALGLEHRSLQIRPKVAELLPQLIWHLDEPIADPAVIACYLVAHEARVNGTTVLLSGQGADELFGGYPRYQAMAATRLLQRLPSALRGLISWGARCLPGTWEGRFGAGLRRLRKVMEHVSLEPAHRFMAYCSPTSDPDLRSVLHPDLRRELVGSTADWSLEQMHNSALAECDQGLLRDLCDYLPNHNLLYTDKMGMAASIEVRVPLLDQELVELVTPWPFPWKVHGTTTKRILRDAARGLVPDAIIDRPKAGFGAPYRTWLRYDLKEMWGDVLSESAVKRRGWFDWHGLQDIRRRSDSGRDDLYMLQWAVLTAELWAREFIDRNPSERKAELIWPAVSRGGMKASPKGKS